jgi:two-component system cell cycle sensor histidine kinase PleC
MIPPFLAEAVHELRTPLNAICGFSEAMKLGLFGPVGEPKYVEYAVAIYAAGMHMQKIINGLLRLARAESGEEMVEIQPVDVGAIIGQAGEFLRIQAEAGGVDLKLNIAAGLTLRSDPTKLMQIILNLGSNAVKYTPRGGGVTIEAKPGDAGGAVIMVIRDTGVGIAPEDIATAMRPFGRVPGKGAISAMQGTGLGLPLAQRYVDQIGGTFTISSAPGRGTIVTVRLPPEPDAAPNNRAAS